VVIVYNNATSAAASLKVQVPVNNSTSFCCGKRLACIFTLTLDYFPTLKRLHSYISDRLARLFIAMAPGIDMSDKNAWDDSFLQNSWNDAVAEYEASWSTCVTCFTG
jgi:hypothetical protein